MAEPPGILDGMKGLVMEALYAFRATKRCPACGSSWNGWYAKKHMDYCHHCGPRTRFELSLPETIHCADCGRIVGETLEEVHNEMAALKTYYQIVVDSETDVTLSGVEWDVDRVAFHDEE